MDICKYPLIFIAPMNKELKKDEILLYVKRWRKKKLLVVHKIDTLALQIIAHVGRQHKSAISIYLFILLW